VPVAVPLTLMLGCKAEAVSAALQQTVPGLLRARKLVLCVALESLVDTTSDPRALRFAQAQGLGAELVTLEGPTPAVHMMARPGLRPWLEGAAQRWELVLYTERGRTLAAPAAKVLDPRGVLFKGRVAHDLAVGSEPAAPGARRCKRVQELLPADSQTAVLLDARADVWAGDRASLLTLPSFDFFRGLAAQVAVAAQAPLSEREAGERAERHRRCVDPGLARADEVLKFVHARFFPRGDAPSAERQLQGRGGDVRVLLDHFRRFILDGLRVFVDDSAGGEHRDKFVQLAQRLGCRVMPTLTHETSIVLTSSKQSRNAELGKKLRVWVLHTDWLRDCANNWQREPSRNYSLFELAD
jgi:RNA polymerase II C-terminal domain phosphatase-like 3/4